MVGRSPLLASLRSAYTVVRGTLNRSAICWTVSPSSSSSSERRSATPDPIARVHNRSVYETPLVRRRFALLAERVPRVGARSAQACRDQGTDASLCPHERRLRTLAPSAGRRGVGLLGREATRQGATGLPCAVATSERRRSWPPRARTPRPRGSCSRLARWLGQTRVARCRS